MSFTSDNTMTPNMCAPQRRAPRFISRCLAAAGAMILVGTNTPCSAASAAEVVNVILTSRYLEQERCDNLGLVSRQLLQGLNSGVGVNQRPALAPEQVREIATRYAAINNQLCDAVTPLFSEHDAWARNYDKFAASNLSNKGWDLFLADQRAVRWAGISARFRTELLALNRVIDLVLALRPDAFSPQARQVRELRTPDARRLPDDIRQVSLTDEEARIRLVLATIHEQPALRALIPARFYVEGLAAIEARTRQIGLQFTSQYRVRLDDLYDSRTRVLLFTVENKAPAPKLDATVRLATVKIKALGSMYR